MMTATPRLAVIAISWIIRILISMMVMKPMVSDSSAIPPGISSRRKVERAASRLLGLSKTSARNALTICTPWLTPIANIRKGTRIDIGSMPNPSSVRSPSCQITAINEQPTMITVSLALCE